MSFWEKQSKSAQSPSTHEIANAMNYAALNGEPAMILDEQAMAELQENPVLDIFDEEEEDTASLMADANLRLEQGRLYQMVLQGDIFADTDADPRAIKNVSREIRKFMRERMETMLGIRQEQVAQAPIVSSPFNDLEVTVLKMLASKMSKGETEKAPQEVGPSLPPQSPKKDGITSISGSLRPQTSPLKKAQSSAPKPVQKAKADSKSALVKEDESLLQKPIDQMTSEELLAHNKAAEERSARKYAKMPNNMAPHPSPQALEMLYTQSATNMTIANPWRVPAQ